ncbi:MAG: ABC transporter ATP-binding protein [Microthrixaceae bacterium]|nr:ABC transporter ATP-binding protein [Microthrixaceae bacterium]
MSRPLVARPGAAMVEFDHVSRWYRKVVAVSEVTLSLGPGVTALLGPNGAGKSTVLRLLCGLTAPSQGTVTIWGHDPRRVPAAMRFIGIVPQHEGVFPNMGPLRFVELAGVLHGLDDPRAAAIASLESVEIDPGDKRSVETYSKGMKQRVKIAQALVNGPAIVVADEPLNGLDPRQRRSLIETFAKLGEQGRCVVISSHVLDEVERFGSRVLVMAQGRLAAEGDFHAIRALMDDRPHLLRLRCDRPREMAARLLAGGTVSGATLVGEDRIEIQTLDLPAFTRAVAPAARAVDALVSEVRPLDDDLESVFRYLVGAPGTGGSV